MEVARYVRVSTTRQQHTQTIAPQLARLRAHVVTQPDWHLAEAHLDRDDGDRGAKLNRPGLDRLRDRAALAAFARVLMTAPDRLARHDVPQVLLSDALAQRGCAVECLDRPMSQDPHDPLRLHIRGAVAASERTLIADRRRRGRQAKRRRGHLWPWSVPPYGDVMDPERPRDPQRLRLDPVTAAVSTQILAWDSRPPDTGHPRWCGHAPHRRPHPDTTRGAALACRLGAGDPPLAGRYGDRLPRAHPASARPHPPVRVAPGGTGTPSSAGPARGMDGPPRAGHHQ